MATISIMGHVERCPQNDSLKDGKPESLYFTLNLSVGVKEFTDADPTDEKPEELLKRVRTYVRPWVWKQITRLRVVGIRKVNAGDVAEEITNVTLAEEPWPGAGDPLAAWYRQLDRKFGSVTMDENGVAIIKRQTFLWPAVDDGGKVVADHTYDGDEAEAPLTRVENHSWATELSDFSTQPAPLPYVANLSRTFWIPAKLLDPYDQLTALPVFQFGKGDPDPVRTPGWPEGGKPVPLQDPKSVLRYLDGNGGPLLWKFAPAEKELDINGYVNSAPVKADGDGWIKLDGAVYRENWLAELEWRAADLFDLPGLLLKYLDALRNPEDPEDKVFGMALKALTPLIKATLRDLVQTGLTCGRRVTPGAPQRSPKDDPVLEKERGLAGDMLRELARVLGLVKDGQVSDEDPDKFRSSATSALKSVKAWEQGREWVSGWWYGWDDEAKKHIPGVLERLPGTLRAIADDSPPAEKARAQLANFAVMSQWHSVLSDEAKVRELVFEQWDAVLTERPRPKPVPAAPPADAKTWWSRYRSLLSERVMPVLGSRKRLQLMHLGVQWDLVTAFGRGGGAKLRTAQDVEKTLVDNLAKVLENYAKQRAFPRAEDAFDDLPPPDGAVLDNAVDDFTRWLHEKYLPTAVHTAVLAGNDPDAVELAQQPDEIVVHVAPVAGGGAADEDDHSRFGMLLRYHDDPNRPNQPGKVRCVTLADVVEPRGPSPVPFLKNVLRAVRPVYRNGVRGGLVSYNNEPLSARSPAIGLADEHELMAAAALDEGEWLQFANPYGAAEADQPRLPGLQFGLEYDVAAFRVGVGGTVPREVCEYDHPTRYVDPAAPGKLPWSKVGYFRRVAVGPVRLESGRRRPAVTRGLRTPGELGDQLDLPPIPASVYPLARSLDALSARKVSARRKAPRPGANGRGGALLSDLTEAADELARSLILLAPQLEKGEDPGDWSPTAARDFTFQVRSPSVDLRVWDRSYQFVDDALTPAPGQRRKTQRRKVWSETFTELDNPEALAGTDVTLDDPVVSGVLVRLTGVFPPAAAQSVRLDFAWKPDGTGGVESEQRDGQTIRVRSTSAKAMSLTRPTGANPCTVSVPRGFVCKLELLAMIPDAAMDRFPKGFAEKCQYESYQGYQLAAPRRFAVEVATPEMPGSEDLLKSLRARTVAGGTLGPIREAWPDQSVVFGTRQAGETLRLNWRTEVAIDPRRLEEPGRAKLQWIHRVNVLVERWRWNGRPLRDAADPEGAADPVRPFSADAFFAAVADGEDAPLIAWDGFLFGDRDAGDYRLHESTVDFAERAPGSHAPLELPARVFHQDVTGDVGALYFRYAVQARSRYEGLFLRGMEDSRRGGLTDDETDQKDAWRRLVVPCRYDKEIPPPRVKLIVPLTDVRREDLPAETAEVTPGLLVVLNEPWFLYGGLAEDLVVEVATADEPVRSQDPEAPPAEAPQVSELGPDAVVAKDRAQTVVPPGEDFPNAYSFEPLVAYGPIGHTFDTDTLAPEFVHTSFVIPAPELKPVDEDSGAASRRDLSWYFVKLRFRRRIEPSGHQAAPQDPESEPTESTWAQFLPPSSVYDADRGAGRVSVRVADLRLKKGATGSGAPWWIVDSLNQSEPLPLLPTATDSDDSRFQVWVLVTEVVHDAYGRLNQERFVDLCALRQGVLQLHDPQGLSGVTRPRARLVELQVLPKPSGVTDWIENAPLNDEDAVAPTVSLPEYFFPRDADVLTEARARWVRVSDAIEPTSD